MAFKKSQKMAFKKSQKMAFKKSQKIRVIFLSAAVICFFASSFATAQTLPTKQQETKTQRQERQKIIIQPLKNALTAILAVWEKKDKSIKEWWKGNILPKINLWLEEKKMEIKKQFKKQVKEMEENTIKGIKNKFSNFWQDLFNKNKK